MLQVIPVTARSKAWVCDRSPTGIVGSNPTGGAKWMSVSREWCVLSGRGLFDGLITRPEESYRVCVCALSVTRCNNDPLHLQ